MSEYIYHKGKMKFADAAAAKKQYDALTKTELGKDYADGDVISLRGDSIILDSIDYGSFPLSMVKEFEDKLLDISSGVSEDSDLERYLYNDGYYKISLHPNKQPDFEKISDEDPNEEMPVADGTAAVGYSLELVLEEMNPDDPDEKLDFLKEYYATLRRLLKEGYIIFTPLGQMIKQKDLGTPEYDITVFKYSEKL